MNTYIININFLSPTTKFLLTDRLELVSDSMRLLKLLKSWNRLSVNRRRELSQDPVVEMWRGFDNLLAWYGYQLCNPRSLLKSERDREEFVDGFDYFSKALVGYVKVSARFAIPNWSTDTAVLLNMIKNHKAFLYNKFEHYKKSFRGATSVDPGKVLMYPQRADIAVPWGTGTVPVFVWNHVEEVK